MRGTEKLDKVRGRRENREGERERECPSNGYRERERERGVEREERGGLVPRGYEQ